MDEPQYVEIELSGEPYAIPIQSIQEIIRYQPPTEVPNGKSGLEGVINLRGQIVSVQHLGKLLGQREQARDHCTRIVIVDRGGQMGGFIVDKVCRVVRYEEVLPTLTQAASAAEASGGIGKSEETLARIIQLEEWMKEGSPDG